MFAFDSDLVKDIYVNIFFEVGECVVKTKDTTPVLENIIYIRPNHLVSPYLLLRQTKSTIQKISSYFIFFSFFASKFSNNKINLFPSKSIFVTMATFTQRMAICYILLAFFLSAGTLFVLFFHACYLIFIAF
jgi:hypothetical protein